VATESRGRSAGSTARARSITATFHHRICEAGSEWNFENRATRLRLESWKTRGDGGGGLLGNFVSHCFYNLEWLCGPICGLSARLVALPDSKADGAVTLALAFASGAAGSLQVSCASFLGSGHRIEFYGEDGTLTLSNPAIELSRLRVAGRAPRRRCFATGRD
jgi:predicted dehydrogenase